MRGVLKICLFLVGFVVSLNDSKFKSLDLDVITRLIKVVQSQSVVFVEDKEDVDLVRSFKTLSGGDFYCTVVNSSFLESVLASNVSQLNFFQRRTAIVASKKDLNLTALLSEVYHPHFLTWIILGDYTLIEDLYIPVSGEVIFVDSSSGRISAKQVYHLQKGKNEIVKPLHLSNRTEIWFPTENKMNFQQSPMKMLVLTLKQNCEHAYRETLLKKLECLHQNFLELMGEMLNFRTKVAAINEQNADTSSINIVECIEKENPFTYPNGSDSELFIRLRNGEVDFSAISHVVRTRRKRNYMDFAWPTFVLKTRMYFKQSRLSGRWMSYLRPLESSVWWGILIWIIGTGILIKIFEKLLVKQLKLNFGLILDLITSTLNALQVFCNQATADIPASYSIRIIYLMKFFVVLIFFQAYCGYLVSSLTVFVSRFPFKDLQGLYENEEYRVMTLRKGFHQFYFKKVIGEGQRENFMLPSEELPNTIQEAVDTLCEREHVAFAEFREDLLNFDKLKCKISELPSPIVHVFVGIAMPKKTPLKEFLGRELLTLKSTGLIKRLSSRLSTHSDFRDDKTQDEFTTVSMTQIFSIFFLLGVGAVLSIGIFIIELIFRERRIPVFLYPEKRVRKYGSSRFSHL